MLVMDRVLAEIAGSAARATSLKRESEGIPALAGI
jgi:hypothetical protein